MKIRNPIFLIYDIFESLSWIIYRIVFRDEAQVLSKGRCKFHGTPDFLSKVKVALEKIEASDPSIYEGLKQTKINYIQSINGVKFWRRINRRFIIEEWMIKEGYDSLIYGIVVFFFHNRGLDLEGRFKLRFFVCDKQNTVGLSHARKWLQENGYDERFIRELELIESSASN